MHAYYRLLLIVSSLSVGTGGCHGQFTTTPPTDDLRQNVDLHHNDIFVSDVLDSAPVNGEGLIWDRHRETAGQLQGRVCSERCDGTEKVNPVSSYRCLQCFPCSCQEHCALHGTCCPSLDQDTWPAPVAVRQTPECQEAKGRWVFRVDTCDPAYPHNETRVLCESKSVGRRRDTALPVTAYDTGVTYSNIHCALCNGHFLKSQVAEWRTMHCRHNQYLYDVINETEYDDRALFLPDLCTPVPPDDRDLLVSLHLCNAFHSDLFPDPISSCNVTGRWEEEEEHVRLACEEAEGSRAAMVTVYNAVVYSSVFCAMCNEPREAFAPTCFVEIAEIMVESMPPKLNSPSHTDLIHYSPKVFRTLFVPPEECPKNQWKHPTKGCQPLQCSKGKVPGRDKQCVTAVDRVRGLGYRLKILLRPVSLMRHEVLTPTPTTTTTSEPTPTTKTTTYEPTAASAYPMPLPASSESLGCHYGIVLKHEIYERFESSSFDMSVTISTADSRASGTCFWLVHQSQLEKLMVGGKVTHRAEDNTTQRRERDLSDRDQLAASFLVVTAEVNIIADKKVSRDSAEKDFLADVFSKDWTVCLHQWTITLRASDLTSGFGESDEGQTSFIIAEGGDVQQTTFPYHSHGHPLYGYEYLFLPLSRLLICQHLIFYEDEFKVVVLEGKHQIRFPNYLDADLEPVSFDVMTYSSETQLVGEEQLLLCLTTFQRVFPQNVTVVQPRREASLTRRVMSVVCSSISVLCLAATFLTYCLFTELRSLPGLTTMGLCCSLAAAHLSLLIPGLRDTGNEQVCVWVGVATHWLWLMALLWMSVGCVRMLRVFVAKTRQSLNPHEVRKAFLGNVIFTVLLSVAMVGLTAAVSAAASRGSSVGYGGSQCFLDTDFHKLMVLAFLMPVAAVVLINLVCFLFTVVAIARVRHLQAQGMSSGCRDILVYAKLATVTGAGWGLALLADLLGQEWALVVAELCTASQGLLLFLAYVCTARVWRLYRSRFGSSGPTSSTSTATAVTVTLSEKAPPADV